MGAYKRIKTSLEELDLIDILLTILLIISLFYSLKLQVDNDNLLKQNDILCSDLNEIKYENELLYNANEELKKDYEYVVDIIRSTDRYQSVEDIEGGKTNE